MSSSDIPSNSNNANNNEENDQHIQNVLNLPKTNEMNDEDEVGRYCWVCFATDEDDNLAAWVQPCKCSGTTKWVHQNCLQRWVDEKQKGNSMKGVKCPQCQTEYIIIIPNGGILVGIIERIDITIKRLSPCLAAGVIFGSLYWTAVTYGAITVLQVVGYHEGLQMMETSDSFVLLIGLPVIPIGLIFGKLIRWDDMILKFIQNRQETVRKLPVLNVFIPIPEEANEGNPNPQNTQILSDPVSASRILCGALLLPTISTIVGKVFFDTIQNNFHRAVIGGLTFIAAKGLLKIYYKQNTFVRRKQRQILDYNEENLKRHSCSHIRLSSNSSTSRNTTANED